MPYKDPEAAREYAARYQRERRSTEVGRRSASQATVRALQKLRAEVVALLGGRCLVCRTTEALEIDHTFGDGGMGGRHRGYSQGVGDRILIRDALRADPFDGRWLLLCKPCHRAKSTEAHQALLRLARAERVGWPVRLGNQERPDR